MHVAALDAIRAVAVGAVLLFHGDVGGARGGFLGVSIFFTLSGFLITSLLLRQWATTSTVDLRAFWTRRFRRLLPASWLTICAVVVMGSIGLWDTEQLRDLRGDVPWSLAELVNWHFIASGTSYGDTFSPPSPLEHFWSLAIEQQFYVILPAVVVLLLVRNGRGDQRARLRTLVVVLALLAAISALINGMAAETNIDRAYFGTDTRAAELLVGALLACATLRRFTIRGRVQRAIVIAAGVVALGALLWLCTAATLTAPWLYPWGLLIAAGCTTTLILAAMQESWFSRVLETRPLPQIGKISYGVYLLHWPIFLWLTPARVGWSDWPLFALRLAVTFAASTVMYVSFESPIRHRRMLNGSNVRLVLPVTAVILIASTLAVTRDLPEPLDFLERREPDDVAVREVPTTVRGDRGTTGTSGLDASTVPSVPVHPQRVLLVGDSIAASLEEALGDALTDRGVTFASAASPGCGIVTGIPADEEGNAIEATRTCENAIPELQANALEAARPDLVVTLSSWEAASRFVDGRYYSMGTPEADDVLRGLFAETLDRLSVSGAAVAFATVPDEVDGEIREASEDNNRRIRALNDLLEGVAETWPGRVTVVPFDQIVCPATPCPPRVDGVSLRPRDGTHFDDDDGARYVAELLADQIVAIDLAQ